MQTGFRSSAEIFGRRTRRSRPGALILPSPIRRIIRRAAGGWCLRFGGSFFLVHKPERLADLMVFLRAARLEPKRLRFVRHSAASAVSLVLLEARLGGKPGLQIEPELVLYGPDGSESAACRRIYHRQE